MMMDTDQIRNFTSWRGTNILRFSVKFRKYQELLDSWLRFATERKVQELQLLVPFKFVLPHYLYSCSSLQDLSLASFDLHLQLDHANIDVQWYRLKRLVIYGDSFSENSINQIMRGEKFLLVFRNINGNLTIRSTSLRSLTIHMLVKRDIGVNVIAPELRIWTPNRQNLDIGGIPHSKCLLMNVSSLTKASLQICGYRRFFPGTDVVVERLSRILPSIKYVRTVVLSDWCIKALGAMKEKHMLSPFPNADLLELKVCSEEYKQIVGVVEMFPNLRNLVIKTSCDQVPKHGESLINLPDSFLLQHLRTIHVTWTCGDDSIFPFMQFLLKYATNLEKLVFSRGKRTVEVIVYGIT